MSDPKVFANSVELKSCLILGNNKSKPFNATDGVLRFDYFENIEAPTVFGSLQIGEESMNSICLLYTSPSPRDRQKSRMPSSA